jgi:hypothetical protein
MFPLRSCYSTTARFFNDSSETGSIRWYWSQPDAPIFQGRHTFAPLSFSAGTDGTSGTVGEVLGSARPWRNGSIPFPAPTGDLDGLPVTFFRGQSRSAPGLARTPFGIPLNCTSEPFFQCCTVEGPNASLWSIETPLGTQIGVLLSIPGGWAVFDLALNPHGVCQCLPYDDTFPDQRNMVVATDIFTGFPANYWALPITDTTSRIIHISHLYPFDDGANRYLRRTAP